jgi:hypothetical protein
VNGFLQADYGEHHDSIIPSPHGVRDNSTNKRGDIHPETVELVARMKFSRIVDCEKSLRFLKEIFWLGGNCDNNNFENLRRAKDFCWPLPSAPATVSPPLRGPGTEPSVEPGGNGN